MSERQQFLQKAREAHDRLAAYRKLRNKLFRDFCENEIPRVYSEIKPEGEPDGRESEQSD